MLKVTCVGCDPLQAFGQFITLERKTKRKTLKATFGTERSFRKVFQESFCVILSVKCRFTCRPLDGRLHWGENSMKPASNLISCIVGNVGVRFLKRRKNNWNKKVDKSYRKPSTESTV